MFQMKPLNILSQLVTYDREVLPKMGLHNSTPAFREGTKEHYQKPITLPSNYENGVGFDAFAHKYLKLKH